MTATLRSLWGRAGPSSPGEPLLARLAVRRALFAALVLLLACNAALSIFFKETDFEWHLREGLRFWNEGPYDPRFLPYPLPRIMLDGLFLPLGFPLARAVAYLCALGLLAVALATWERLAREEGAVPPLSPALRFSAVALALLVLHPYLARDLNDCGPHITTLTLCVLALAALLRRRPLLAGLLLATAAVWAATPLLFLPYLLLKRQGRAAAAMAGGIALWCLLPALAIGWQATLAYHQEWLGRLLATLSEQDLTALPYEPARHQSQALRMVFARFTTHFGPDHPIHLDNDLRDHPLFVQFLDLPMVTAKAAYGALLVALGAAFAWRFRRPLRTAEEEAGSRAWLLPEWALVLLLMPLLGPTAWLHHFAVALPAALLVAHHAVGEGRSLAAWRRWSLGFIAVVLLLLQRDVVQRELSILVLSYKFDAFAMILLLVLTLALPAMRGQAGAKEGRNGVDRTGVAA